MRARIPRRFRRDPLLGAAPGAPPGAQDLRSHPVIEAILRRREQGSRPGARSDGKRIALVIEGGGMRGVVSAGMAAAIEQLGLRDAFDEVYGASAGAFNAAFLLAGQASYLAGLYAHGFGDPGFISIRRSLRGRPLFDMDYVVDQVWRHRRPLRIERILQGAIELHCSATDVDLAAPVDLQRLGDAHEIRLALKASARLPWLAGGPVRFRGRRLLDATLAEAIPVAAAQRSASDILVLQTRPQGVCHGSLSRPVAALTDRYLSALNPALVQLRKSRSERYDRLSAELQRRAGDPAGEPAVCVIRPPAGGLLVSQLESRQSMLALAAAEGLRAAWIALTGEDPELVSVPFAYPRGAPGRHQTPSAPLSASAVAPLAGDT
jgi:predicted patatin/cPLA2 family phospholipase